MFCFFFYLFVKEMSEVIVLITLFVFSAAQMQNATSPSITTSSSLVYPGPTASHKNVNKSVFSILSTTVKPPTFKAVSAIVKPPELTTISTSIKATASITVSTTSKPANFTTASTSLNATGSTTVRSTSVTGTTLSSPYNSTTAKPLTNSTFPGPKPISLKITPEVSEYGGESSKHYSLTCYATGTNLPKILPYKLCWYQQGDAGRSLLVKCELNGTSVIFDKYLATLHYSTGARIYCALIFNKLNPTHYSLLHSKYIDLQATAVENSLTQLIIALSTFALCLFLLGVLAAFICRRCRKLREISPPPIPEEPSVTSQDNIYTYVPLQTVTFYEAKALAAANKKYKMKSAEPPPLPARPKKHNISKSKI